MKTLLPMVDYILLLNKRLTEDTFFDVFKYVTLSIKYSEFLKRKLELWMFIPCDSKGKPLPEPEGYKEFVNKGIPKKGNYVHLQKMIEYQIAKDRIIFPDCYLNGKQIQGKCSIPIDMLNNYNINFMADNLTSIELSEKTQKYLEKIDLAPHD